MVDHVEVAKGGQVCRFAIGASRADEADGPRDDGRDEELVVVDGGPALLVGVDFDVRHLQRCAVVVGARSELPGWRDGLREVPGLGAVPGCAGGFDGFEVWVWVAVDELFGIGALLGRGRHFGVGGRRLRLDGC